MDTQTAGLDALISWAAPGAFWETQGLWEVNTSWVSEFQDDVVIVDVRQPDEFNDQLGHIIRAELVPLPTLSSNALKRWSRRIPLVLVCRSGGRSLRGAAILSQLGYEKVASMAGGMIAWNTCGLPVE